MHHLLVLHWADAVVDLTGTLAGESVQGRVTITNSTVSKVATLKAVGSTFVTVSSQFIAKAAWYNLATIWYTVHSTIHLGIISSVLTLITHT